MTNKYYIGSAIDFDERWRLHLQAFKSINHHNRHMQRAWDKYGELQFGFFILEITADMEVREQYWIDKLDATNRHRGYNICKAGRNRYGVKASEETRRKLSESHKGHKQSAETRAKMSASQLGNQVNKGRKWSSEAIEKRRLANIGQKRSEEGRKNISESLKGRIVSLETREKMRLAKLGRKHSEQAKSNMRGHVISEETRKKLSLAAQKQWALQKAVKANDSTLDYTSDMWV